MFIFTQPEHKHEHEHEHTTYVNIIMDIFTIMYIKGSVQRKLRWVENGVNRSVGTSDCGAGHSFVVLFGFHLGFAIFPFPVSTAKIIADSGKIDDAVPAT
jgi:adenosine deaminase